MEGVDSVDKPLLDAAGSGSPCWECDEKDNKVQLMNWKRDLMTAFRMDLNRPS